MILSISNVCTFDRFGRFRYLCIFFSSLLMKISRLKCPNLSNVCCADAQKSLITIAIYIYIYIYIYLVIVKYIRELIAFGLLYDS